MPRILIVEDDSDIVENLSILLQDEGYSVCCASSMEQALNTLHAENIDLVLLDITLPDGNGYSVCTAVKRQTNAPVIFLTAMADESSIVTGFQLGADDYMVKPIDLDELFLRIGALLRRAKIASNRKLEIGSFVMDADEHTAYLNGEEISLTNREFSILYKLLSYPKKTFTRTQLMDEFWDANTDAAPRAVDVYMTKLRSKLSECNDFEIVTVHGLGYKAVLK